METHKTHIVGGLLFAFERSGGGTTGLESIVMFERRNGDNNDADADADADADKCNEDEH
jgi:hypothetical protein